MIVRINVFHLNDCLINYGRYINICTLTNYGLDILRSMKIKSSYIYLDGIIKHVELKYAFTFYG